MRILAAFALILSVMTLAACKGSSDDSGRRGQSGAYISGGGGVGF